MFKKFSRTKLTAIVGILVSALATVLDLPPEVQGYLNEALTGVLFLALWFLRDSIPEDQAPRLR